MSTFGRALKRIYPGAESPAPPAALPRPGTATWTPPRPAPPAIPVGFTNFGDHIVFGHLFPPDWRP